MNEYGTYIQSRTGEAMKSITIHNLILNTVIVSNTVNLKGIKHNKLTLLRNIHHLRVQEYEIKVISCFGKELDQDTKAPK